MTGQVIGKAYAAAIFAAWMTLRSASLKPSER